MYFQQLPTDPLIKLEICEILDLYLDSKMDFYLNNLKLQFSEWVNQMNLFDKIMSGESDFDKEDQRAEMQRLFKDKIKENIDSVLPAIMKTGTSVDEEIFKKKEENQIFGLMNLANKLVNLEDKAT